MLPIVLINQSRAQRIQPIKNMSNKSELLVHETFYSIQGESTFQGRPCFFIRLTGCHLRCRYCDTANAFFDGKNRSLESIILETKEVGCNLIEITGGEPLLQPATFELARQLCDLGRTVLIETSGCIDISKLDRRVKVIMDIKTPSSGEEKRNIWKNIDVIWPGCEIKFVIGSREDYVFSKRLVCKYSLSGKVPVLFSPSYGQIDLEDLSAWILEDKLEVRLQIQLHKSIWGEKKGV